MFAPDHAADGRRAAARHPPGRDDRARQLGARLVHRRPVPHHRRPRRRRRPASSRPACGARRTTCASLLGDGVSELRAERRTYTFRYRSPEHMRRLLPHLVRADAQGVRGARRGRPARRSRPTSRRSWRARTASSRRGRRWRPGRLPGGRRDARGLALAGRRRRLAYLGAVPRRVGERRARAGPARDRRRRSARRASRVSLARRVFPALRSGCLARSRSRPCGAAGAAWRACA